MTKHAPLEYWLRGSVPGIPALLQPAAHALLQAREEVKILMTGFPAERLWDRPAGVAAVGFHLRHLTGVLDRLLTYARGEVLDQGQLEYLAGEGVPESGSVEDGDLVRELVNRFNQQIDKALVQIASTPEGSLTDVREVGRGRIPSTVGGLIFHAAEHTQRHVGQLLVTVSVLSSSELSGGRKVGEAGNK
jgi:hypothetical protein